MATLASADFESGGFGLLVPTTAGATVQSGVALAGAFSLKCVATGTGNASADLFLRGPTPRPDVSIDDFLTTWAFRVDVAPTAGTEGILSLQTIAGTYLGWLLMDASRKLSMADASATARVGPGATALTLTTTYTLALLMRRTPGGSIWSFGLTINGNAELGGTFDFQGDSCGGLQFGKDGNLNGNSMTTYYDSITVTDTTVPRAVAVSAPAFARVLRVQAT